jgi:orotate phosphoribosyltransferase
MSDGRRDGLDFSGKGGGLGPSSLDVFWHLYKTRAVLNGTFKLRSGRTSNFYIDSKRVLFHPESLLHLGDVLADAVVGLDFDVVGGPETGAIPMTAALLLELERRTGGNTRAEGFYVRRAAKDHGSQKRVEGPLRSGHRVVILEDVVTTGQSVLSAIREVEAESAQVVRVIAICDRLEGGQDALRAYDYRPLFTLRDFGLEPLPRDGG